MLTSYTSTLHQQSVLVCVRGGVRSPLGVLVLHVAESRYAAGQLLPQGGAVACLHGLVHQHHRRQHLHSHQQLGVGQRPLWDQGTLSTSGGGDADLRCFLFSVGPKSDLRSAALKKNLIGEICWSLAAC